MKKTIRIVESSWSNGKPAYGTEVRDENDQIIVPFDLECRADTPQEALDNLLIERPDLADAEVINPVVPPYDSALKHE